MIMPTSSATKRPLSVGNVPAEAGTSFFAASDPAIASTGTIDGEAADHHGDGAGQVVEGRVALRPAKALPLLPVCEA